MATGRNAVWNWGRSYANTGIEIGNIISNLKKYQKTGNAEDLMQTIFSTLSAAGNLADHVAGAIGFDSSLTRYLDTS